MNILKDAGSHFDKWSEFISRLGLNVAMMQLNQHYYSKRHMSTDQLVEKYLDAERTVYWLRKLGWGGVGGAFGASVAEGIKKGSVKTAINKGAGRLVGRGAIVESIQSRLGPRIPPKAGGVAGIIIIGSGTIAYYNGVAQMEEIREILKDRFQDGKMSNSQFSRVFGSEISPEDVRKYWE